MIDNISMVAIQTGINYMGADSESVMTPFCRKTKFVNLTKVLVCLLVIVSLLLTMVVPVHAIALTTGIAIATVGALVLAACGVVLTAPTGQSLTDYIGSQIDSYAVSQGYSNRSTWLNGVTQQTVTSTTIWSILDNAVKIPGGIYNALVTWAGSYIENEGIVESGPPVGELGSGVTSNFISNSNFRGSFSGEGVTKNTISISCSNAYTVTTSGVSGYANISIPFDNHAGDYTITVLSKDNTGSFDFGVIPFFYYNNTTLISPSTANLIRHAGDSITITKQSEDYLRFGCYVSGLSSMPSTGTIVVEVSGNNNFASDAGCVVTPTEDVVIPVDAGLGQDVIISGLPVSSSMTPEAAADAIQDQATTSDGLTATPSLDGEAVPEGSGWLYNAIQSVGEFIVDGIGGLFIPSEGFWDVYVDNISDLFDDRMGLLTYPISVVADLFGRVADLEDAEPILRWNDVVWKNQVVIPGGSYNLNDILEEDSMETIYGIYRVVVSGIMVIALIHLFIKKLEEIETK